MNWFQKLKGTRPRIWTVVTLPAYIFATFILFPIEVLCAFVPNIWHEIREMFNHLRWDWRDSYREGAYIIKWCWKDWFSIVKTGKGLNDETEQG